MDSNTQCFCFLGHFSLNCLHNQHLSKSILHPFCSLEPSRNVGEGRHCKLSIYFPHPANQSGLLLRALATVSQFVVTPGMGMKTEAQAPPGGRLQAGVPDKAVGGSEI